MTSVASVPVIPPQSQTHGGESNPLLVDLNRIRDLAEQIRQRCAHAHLTGQQQTAPGFQVQAIASVVWVGHLLGPGSFRLPLKLVRVSGDNLLVW